MAEFRIVDKKGTVYNMEEIGSIQRNKEKKLTGMVGIIRDITARKSIESGYKRMIDASPWGMHMYELKDNGDLIFTGANKAADMILHVDNNQFIGKKIEDAFPPLEKTEIPKKYKEAAAKGKSWKTEQVTYEYGKISGVYEVRAVQTSPNKMAAMFMDITERRKSEETLKENEEKYRTFIENFQGIAYKSNINPPTPIFFQGAVKEITGYTEKEMLKKRWDKIIYPDDFKKIVLSWEKIAKTPGYSTEREYRIISKDNKIKWIYERSKNISQNNKPVYVQGTLHDITEQKKSKEALKESEEKFKTFFDSTADMIVIVNTRGKIINVNKRFEEESGYKKSEVINKNVLTAGIVSKKSMFNIAKEMKNIILGKKWKDITIEGITKKGELIPYEIRSQPIKKEGKIVAIQSILRNITEREKAEEAIKESEKRNRNIIESSPIGMHIYELKENGKLIFTGANPSAGKILGLDHKKLIGNTIEQAFPALKNTEVPKIYKKIAAKGGKWHLSEFPYEHGNIKGIFSIDAFQSSKGKMVTAFTDITERKKQENIIKESHKKLIRAYENLKEVDKIKADFVSAAGHQLKTPLTSVLGYLELIPPKTEKLDKIQKEGLEMIRKNSKKLKILIEDILMSLKMNTPDLQTKKTNVPICKIIKDALSTFKPKIAEKGITLVNKIPKTCNHVYANSNQMNTLITNLIGNAIKYNKPNGKIIIDSKIEKTTFTLIVSDTGIGMNKKHLSNVFTKFFQANISLPGSGLGLSICKSIAKSHGGKIRAESKGLGKGSKFIFTIPLKDHH